MATLRSKFDTFIGGYSEMNQHHIPSDVQQLCMIYVSPKPCINFKMVTFERNDTGYYGQQLFERQCNNEIEIFVDELTAKFAIISYYQMDAVYVLRKDQILRFKAALDKQEIASQISSELPHSFKIDRTERNKFHDDTSYLSYLSFRFGLDCNAIYQLSAIDNNSDVICKTEWTLYENAKEQVFTGRCSWLNDDKRRANYLEDIWI